MVGTVAPWFERPQLSRETGEISKVKKLQVEGAEYCNASSVRWVMRTYYCLSRH